MTRSLTAVFFSSETSKSAKPGPLKVPRPRFPKVPATGSVKAFGSNHWVWRSSSTGPENAGFSDGRSGFLINMTQARNKAAIDKQLEAASLGDPPSYMPFLQMANDALLKTDATLKHIVILGDGDATEQNTQPVQNLLQGASAKGVTTSAIAVDAELRSRKLKTRMLLQVHDELIFEAPHDEVEQLVQLVCEKMEGAYPELRVRLKVDVEQGPNWEEMEGVVMRKT